MKKARFPLVPTEDASVRKESGFYEQETIVGFSDRRGAFECIRFAAGFGLDFEEGNF